MERYFTLAANNEFSGPNNDIPVIVEAGPFETLAEALAIWPDSHVASDHECATYSAYWADK